MNIPPIFASQPWVERLGWTLLHFLWQGLVIAILYAAARWLGARKSSPRSRYLLACGAMVAMVATPIVTWEAMRPSRASSEAIYRINSTPPTSAVDGTAVKTGLPDSWRATVSGANSDQFLSWVVMVWLAGVIVFWGRLAGGWVIASRMRSMLVRRAPAEWQQVLKDLGERIGLSRPVRLLVSALVQVPTVVGWLRPVVLVPVGALGGLPAEHVEALLLHELAHIRRHDYLINILQSVAESLLFYHPAVWWVSGHMRAERELCCDDLAVSTGGNVLAYARALAEMESCRPTYFGAALAANGGNLSNRIARLLGRPRPAATTRLGPGFVAVTILLAGAAYGLFGQSSAHPAFEVASIKPHAPEGGDPTRGPMGGGFQPGGRLHMVNMPLVGLIQFAYADHDSPHWLPLPLARVVGGPAWAKTDGYDIEAKPESKTDPKHMWLMLQALLADRFQLVLRKETRELPVYELKVAKGGPKLPPAKDVGCVSFPPGTPPRQVPGKVDCGYVSGPGVQGFGGPLHINGRKVHVSDLARELTSAMGRPVVDETGFTGEFDLDLSFIPDQSLEGFRYPGPSERFYPPPTEGPNIVVALEEQLGLKLVGAKAPVDVLVIDHAERPTRN